MTAITTVRALFFGVLLLGAGLAAAACGTGNNGAPPPEAAAQPDVAPPASPDAPGSTTAAPDTAARAPETQLANPASVNCEKKGGRVELRNEPAGQFGVCVFPDGSRCEEWRFFRDECKPGECQADDGKCEAKKN